MTNLVELVAVTPAFEHARFQPARIGKALSWENLQFDTSAYILRYYRKVVFFELVV